MKNCVYWWFTVKNFSRKCHRKQTTITASLLFFTITFALWREKFLYKAWVNFHDVWVKVKLGMSHIWTQSFKQKSRNQWLLAVVEQLYVFLSHFFVRFYSLLTIQDDWWCSCVPSDFWIRNWAVSIILSFSQASFNNQIFLSSFFR